MLQTNKLKGYINHLAQKRVTTVAGAWVFYFLSALLPLTFLLITAYGVFGVDVSMQLVAQLPERFRDNATVLIQTAKNASKGVTVFFVASVVLSGSALIRQMMKDGQFIYGVHTDFWGGIKVLKGVFATIVLYAIFLASAMVATFGEIIFAKVLNGRSNLIFAVFYAVIFTLLCYAVIVMLNKFICPIAVKKRVLCFASLISLTIMFVGTISLRIYFKIFSNINAFYGSLAGMVGFLIWAYICMLGLVVGVIVCAYMHNLKKFS